MMHAISPFWLCYLGVALTINVIKCPLLPCPFKPSLEKKYYEMQPIFLQLHATK
jgi:hypothetical protein